MPSSDQVIGPIRRRQALRLVSMSMLPAWLAPTASAMEYVATDSWPQFGHDAGNTGYNPAGTGTSTSLERVWTYDTGGPVGSSPAVADGTVYVGTESNALLALDAADGTRRWRFDTETSVTTSPAVHDGTVFVGTEGSVLYAVDASNGSVKWQYSLGDRGVHSPTVAGDTIYVGGVNQPLHAVTAKSGDRKWLTPFEGTILAPAVDDCGVYALGNRLHGVAIESGTARWQTEGWRTLFAAPAVAERTVYVNPYNRPFHAFDARSGELLWEADAGNGASSPAVAHDHVVVGQKSGLVDLHAGDGSERWTVETDAAVNSSPAIVGDVVYVGSDDGLIHAVDLNEGTTLSTYATGGPVSSSPAVADDTVYVGSQDGTVYALTAVEAASDPIRTATPTDATPGTDSGDSCWKEPSVDVTPSEPRTTTAQRTMPPTSQTSEPGETTGGDGPGFGVGPTLAGVAGLGLLLRRRFSDSAEESEGGD